MQSLINYIRSIHQSTLRDIIGDDTVFEKFNYELEYSSPPRYNSLWVLPAETQLRLMQMFIEKNKITNGQEVYVNDAAKQYCDGVGAIISEDEKQLKAFVAGSGWQENKSKDEFKKVMPCIVATAFEHAEIRFRCLNLVKEISGVLSLLRQYEKPEEEILLIQKAAELLGEYAIDHTQDRLIQKFSKP